MKTAAHHKDSKQKVGKQISTFKLILFFFRPHKLQVVLLLLLSVAAGGLEAANVATVYPILTTAFDTGSGEGNVILSLLRAAANLLPVGDEFISYCVLFLLIALLTFAAKLITINFGVRLETRLVEGNQIELFSKFIKADYQYFVDHKQGELIYNVASAPQSLSALIAATTDLVSRAILSISILILLFSLSWQGAIVVLLIGLGYHYFTRYLGRKVSYLSGKGEMEAFREGNVILNETISGIKQVKVYATGKDWFDRFSSTVKRRWHYFRKRAVWQQIPPPFLMLILYFSVGITAMTIKIITPTSFIQLTPLLGTFCFAAFRLFPIVGALGALTMQIMGSLPNCEVVYSIRNDKIAHIEDGEKELSSFKSDVHFDNVTFAYKRKHRILENISITFEKGKATAIVGRSGMGKTTIINLLLRLFETSQGKITIDGSEIKEYKLSSWQGKIGFVSQDTFIYNDTIKNNITYHSEE